MDLSENELQHQAEHNAPADPRNPEYIAYQALFRALKQPPAYRAAGLEDAIVARIQRSRRRSVYKDHAWLAAGIFILLIAGVVAVLLSGLRLSLSDWQLDLIALAGFSACVIVVLNRVEKRLLPGKTS